METLQDAIRDAIEVEVRSGGEWDSVQTNEGEGSLSNIVVDESEIDADYSDLGTESVTVTVKGAGTIFIKKDDGTEQEHEEDLVLTADVTISVVGSATDGIYPVKIDVTVTSVQLDE